ncbi:uncharacterized protein MONBRDRAFT_18531 [Monosiga brevicollis MX1]|uniref:phosphoserine transaminase n=1 Tax=Monosiga brevicollis TaxID=81824 RepID=A9UW97_MONBE|nr:uncharacterized protein MONBRDRAFT_18531 [Monosiga brevicollis MX1]EDQ90527.1 predicted protein [Monosiga brevicollis MX1]|eukprot:XP_001744578.1 hypothetical protein [Monosiga brevicollis MX1]
MSERVINFSAGPAHLPEEVLRTAQSEMLNWHGSGMSVMEMSHRGKHFKQIIEEAEASLRRIMSIPENYKVLFLQGGGMGQFAAVPLNLLPENGKAAYAVTGGWSQKAIQEADKYGTAAPCFPKLKSFTDIPPVADWTIDPDAEYVYICDNETVFGVEYPEVPDVGDKILVADISSNFLTRPVDVSKFGLLYAGVQKNAGPAGCTIVIVREDLLGKARTACPSVLDYKLMADNDSMPNTPPCWSIYVTGLVFAWIEREGGLAEFARRSEAKSKLLYEAIDGSAGFYACPVAERVRSRVNVPFRIQIDGTASEELEAKFVAAAEAQGMSSLKGHRSVGGIRASLYNATTLEQTQKLVDFMAAFRQEHSN